jgi:hypothetical protein
MDQNLTEHEIDIIWSFQNASHDRIFSQLRLVSIEWLGYPYLYFYTDGKVHADDYESISLMISYFGIDSSAPDMDDADGEIVEVSAPEPIHNPGICLYARKENSPVGNPPRPVLLEKEISRQKKIRVAAQRAIIDNVFPQLRSVEVSFDQISATLYFRIDGELTQDNTKSLSLIQAYFSLQFPKEEMQQCDMKIIRFDTPQLILDSYGELIYLRKEFSAFGPSINPHLY